MWICAWPIEARADDSECPPIPETGFEAVSMDSPQTAERECHILLLPPNHGELESMHLVVLLHGMGAKPTDWLRGTQLVRELWRRQESGELPATALLLPQGENGYWARWADGSKDYEKLVLDLIEDVREETSVSSKSDESAILGVSMGGFGALSIGLRNPTLFGVILAMSPTDMELALTESPRRRLYTQLVGYPHSKEIVDAINPYQIVQNSETMDSKIVLVYGESEPAKFSQGSERLIGLLKAEGYSVQHREVPQGTHSWATTWSAENQVWILDQLQARWSE
jgi:enterochelin esterase-like enzyme